MQRMVSVAILLGLRVNFRRMVCADLDGVAVWFRRKAILENMGV